MTRPEYARQAQGPGDVDPRRAPKAQPFVLEKIEDDRHRLFVGNLIRDVDRRAFEILGDPTLADFLGDG